MSVRLVTYIKGYGLVERHLSGEVSEKGKETTFSGNGRTNKRAVEWGKTSEGNVKGNAHSQVISDDSPSHIRKFIVV